MTFVWYFVLQLLHRDEKTQFYENVAGPPLIYDEIDGITVIVGSIIFFPLSYPTKCKISNLTSSAHFYITWQAVELPHFRYLTLVSHAKVLVNVR